MLTMGVNHKIMFKNNGQWHTAIAGAYFKNNIDEEYVEDANNDQIADAPILYSSMKQKKLSDDFHY